jgi:hypothetical protein
VEIFDFMPGTVLERLSRALDSASLDEAVSPRPPNVRSSLVGVPKRGISQMAGKLPAGRPWAAAEEAQLRDLIISRVKVGLIAKKLKRSPGAVYARINSLKKRPRDLASGRQPRSLPSERLAYAKAQNSKPEH